MFGVLLGVQSCLPLIRKSKGRIVTTTSGLSRMAVPTRSPYVFTKYALAGFTDVLRYEMEAFGVKVHLENYPWEQDTYFREKQNDIGTKNITNL